MTTLWRWAWPMYRGHSPCTLLLRSALRKKKRRKNKTTKRGEVIVAPQCMTCIEFQIRSNTWYHPSPLFLSGHFIPFFFAVRLVPSLPIVNCVEKGKEKENRKKIYHVPCLPSQGCPFQRKITQRKNRKKPHREPCLPSQGSPIPFLARGKSAPAARQQ